jgi:hypothetical protein
VQVLDKKPFDFQKLRVIIKRTGKEDAEVLLDKKWTYDNIKHFRPVIKGVSDNEGIEITLTCNLEAFKFILEYLKGETPDAQEEVLTQVTNENCLNIIVTAEFLKL